MNAVPDTGAVVSVTTSDMFPGYSTQENAASRYGRGFVSASKHSIPCVGEVSVPAQSCEGVWSKRKWQLAPPGKVAKPLLSIGTECDDNNVVLFGKAGGAIFNLDGQGVRRFTRLSNGAYEVQMRIPPAALTEQLCPGFTRQG